MLGFYAISVKHCQKSSRPQLLQSSFVKHQGADLLSTEFTTYGSCGFLFACCSVAFFECCLEEQSNSFCFRHVDSIQSSDSQVNSW